MCGRGVYITDATVSNEDCDKEIGKSRTSICGFQLGQTVAISGESQENTILHQIQIAPEIISAKITKEKLETQCDHEG